MAFSVATLLLSTLLLSVRAVPVSQTFSTDILFDAVVFGTDNIIKLMPAITGLPTPISTFVDFDIVICHSGEICIEKVSTDSTGNVASSVAVQFSIPPASILTALKDIVEAIEAGSEADKTASSATGVLSTPPASSSTGHSKTSRGVVSNSASQDFKSYNSTSGSTTQGSASSRILVMKDLADRLTHPTGVINLVSAALRKASTSSGTAKPSSISKAIGDTTSAMNSSVAPFSLTNAEKGIPTATNRFSVTDQGLGGGNRTRSLAATTPPSNGLVTSSLPTLLRSSPIRLLCLLFEMFSE